MTDVTHSARTISKEEAAARSMCGTGHWSNHVAVTFTLKQNLFSDRRAYIDFERASKNFRAFMKLLNRRCLGRSARRFPQDRFIPVIPMMEKETFGRLHFHAVMEKPKVMADDEFAKAVRECWQKTPYGHQHVVIKFSADEGWNTYMHKNRSKASFECKLDALDVQNLRQKPKPV